MTAYELRISDWSSDVFSSDLDAHMCVVAITVRSARAADDVVVEHGLDRPALLPGVVRQELAAEQPLLLAREHGIDDGRGELALRSEERRVGKEGDSTCGHR